MRMFIKYNLHFFKEITLKPFPLRNLSEFLRGKEKVMKALSTVAYILRNFNSSFLSFHQQTQHCTVVYCPTSSFA
jgi:hypothetical protein